MWMNFILKHFRKTPIVAVNQWEESVQAFPARRITSEIDYAKFYSGYDFKLNDKITIRQPTVGDIVENLGEFNYYRLIHQLTTIPSDHISELWDQGIDFQTVSNLVFLFMMTRNMDIKDSSFLFGDNVDFRKFELCNSDSGIVLYDNENNIVITESDCEKISKVLCMWNGRKKEPVMAAGPMALRALIELDKQEKEEASKKKPTSSMVPMISSLVNHEGFKYNLEETLSLKIFFFMDCISRIGTKVSTDRLAFGYYSGSFDTKKFKPDKQLNWMRDLYS
jgi:hypothetical protein